MFEITSTDIRMLEAIRGPVGIYLMLGCVVVFLMQHLMKKSYRGSALYLVQYYRKNLGLSFLIVFLWWVPVLMFLFRYLKCFWKEKPRKIFVDVGIEWCKWLASDKK